MAETSNKDKLEIIPLVESNQRNNRGNVKMPYMADRSIVPRVQKYLESHGSHIDLNVMADELQQTYREYTRLKRGTFRASVKKAYSIVLHTYGLEDPDSSSSEEDTEESGGEYTNPLNNQLIGLMQRPSGKHLDENELIDISSDDSETNAPEKIKPSTSVGKKEGAKMNDKAQGGLKRKAEVLGVPQYQTVNKKKKSLATLQEPSVSFKDLGGMDKVLEEVCKLLIHIRHPDVYRQIGVAPPRGFLLHGPPGCGKTLLANAIAGEIGVPLLKVAAPELVAGVSGESEERIRELFERAVCSTPCILFIDEIDAITPNRQNTQKEMERRIVAQLLTCLDDLNQNESADRLLVIGATNRPDGIDPALRRAGRFDREICLGIPDVQARGQILKVLTSKLKLSDGFDYDSLAKFTPGFVGADLMSLTREAAMTAVNRVFNELKEKKEKKKLDTSDPEIIVDDEPKEKTQDGASTDTVVIIDDENKQSVEAPEAVNGHLPKEVVVKPTTPLQDLLAWLHEGSPLSQNELTSLCITMDDFAKALKFVQPSAKREGFATVPDVSWEDVGALSSIKEELQMAILAPIKHSEQFKELGLTTPTGVLLCGPPGCGKTLLAKAIANEAGINFISVKGPELLNMYVGESERAIRVCFERARNSAPCVIFFDELDAICPKRSDSREGGATMRVVNQMLTEMDGVQERQGVFLLAASNRPDIIDPAVLRPGRLDKILFVGLPTSAARVEILRAITKNGTQPRLAPDVDLEAIGISDQCLGFTGADLAAFVREAAMVALKEYMLDTQQPLLVSTEHFNKAVVKIRPSVPEKDQKHYEKLRKMYSAVNDNDVEEMEYS